MLRELKRRIQQTRLATVITANTAMVRLYCTERGMTPTGRIIVSSVGSCWSVGVLAAAFSASFRFAKPINPMSPRSHRKRCATEKSAHCNHLRIDLTRSTDN